MEGGVSERRCLRIHGKITDGKGANAFEYRTLGVARKGSEKLQKKRNEKPTTANDGVLGPEHGRDRAQQGTAPGRDRGQRGTAGEPNLTNQTHQPDHPSIQKSHLQRPPKDCTRVSL